MKIAFSFFPVIIFLTFLFLLDNFRLVRVKTLIYCFLWGILCTIAAYLLNTLLANWLKTDSTFLSRHIAPVTEETLKERFAPEVIVDMYCYIGLFLELSIKAKRNLMLNETGFPIMFEDDLESKLAELAQLRKLIGPVGELALAPLIRMNYRNLWKLNQLKA